MDIRTDEEILVALAERAKDARKRRRLSQSELAAKAGTSRTVVQRLEGNGEITLSNLVKIARALSLTQELDGLFEQPEFSPREKFLDLAKRAKTKGREKKEKSAAPQKDRENLS